MSTMSTTAMTIARQIILFLAAFWLLSALVSSRLASLVRTAVLTMFASMSSIICPCSFTSTARSWNISFTSPICC